MNFIKLDLIKFEFKDFCFIWMVWIYNIKYYLNIKFQMEDKNGNQESQYKPF